MYQKQIAMQVIKLTKNVISGFGNVIFPANTEIIFDETTRMMTHPTMPNIKMELLLKYKYTVVE